MKERSKESKERKAVVVVEEKKEKETTTTSRAGVPPRATREASLLKSRRTRCSLISRRSRRLRRPYALRWT